MAVRFIFGRSGTGKTRYCVDAVVDALWGRDEQPLVLLVPEQASYQAERAILGDERLTGYNRLNVLSFDRLQFLLGGKSLAGASISRIGRQMIVHKILRENKDALQLLNSTAEHPGLARQMADTIAELHEYAKTPEDIAQFVDELQKSEQGGLTSLKFADIELILREYLSFIEGRFLDPEVQLRRACEAVGEAAFIKGGRLWVDGFAGFTSGELAILKELLKAAEDSTIALCLDPSEIGSGDPRVDDIDMGELFYPTLRTYADLVEIIKQAKLELVEPIVLQEQMRFSDCPPLAHIERSASQDHAARIDAGDNIRIVSAANERAEVRFVAEEVLRLVKGGDYRYRDIAVIASDIERYQHYVEAYFNDYGLPFFIDRRRPLSRHPAIGLVSSALQIASGDFSSSDIFAYLKTDLVPVNRFDVDLLENYCLAFGITASDWLSDKKWGFAGGGSDEFDEKRINRIRRKVAEPLLELREKLESTDEGDNKISVEQFSGAVFGLLEKLKVCETIGGWVRLASEQGDNASVDEHRQFYDKLVDVFDELGKVFSGTLLSGDDFAAIIGSAFSQLTLAFIPPKLDQVLVGSIERSRHPNLKAVFLIGATQKHFPVPVGSGGILSDEDRRLAEKAKFDIAGGSEQDLVERRYLAYIAFTRASEFLCVTYPAVDEKGSGIPRSQFVAELESRFEGLDEESVSTAHSDIENIHNRTGLIETLCTRLGKDSDEFDDGDAGDFSGLLDAMRSDETLADAAMVVDSALDYENSSGLDDGIVSQFFDKKLRSSATRLGAFAACPYQHFARYMLGLKERKEFKFEPLDLGNFYHAVLDALVKEVRARALSFAAIDDEQLKKILHEQIERLAEGDSFLANFARHGPHNAFILQNAGEILEDCVLAVGRMVRAGSFEPALSEVAFGLSGYDGDTLGKYELALPNGRVLSLNGKIDRLDTTKVEGEELTVVFDYKRTSRAFNWTRFRHGLDMQLPIYMLAVRDTAEATKGRKVVGAFFMPVEVATESTTVGKLSDAVGKFRHKAKGICNGEFFEQFDKANSNKFYNFLVTTKGDQYGRENTSGALRPDDFQNVLTFAEKKITSLAQDIFAGKIDTRPYRIGTASPCGYCKYKPVCRFDWQINDYNPLETLDKTAVLEKIGGADG